MYLNRLPGYSRVVRFGTYMFCACTALLAGSGLSAQTTYTVVDLSKPGSFDVANATRGATTGGGTAASPSLLTRAALWSGLDLTDLHPSQVLGVSTTARSIVTGVAPGLQVGWGIGPNTTNRSVALAWRDTVESAWVLATPFASYSSQALGTDGQQVVGYAIGFARDGTTTDAGHALLWDGPTGVATDLGLGAQAVGVGGGQQVGTITKSVPNAALWRGTSKSLVVLHPAGAVSSMARATDGIRQVGSANYEIRIRVEANKGNKTAVYSYATVWSGTAASAINIHAYPLTHSYATSVAGSFVAGYGADATKSGTPAYYHALVWDSSLVATDLNAFLPAGFVGSQALSVDNEGYVAGYMISPTGERHAALWIPNL